MHPFPNASRRPSAAAAAALVWDAANKAAAVTLSNADLTAAVTGGGYPGVRGTTAKSSGIWYWELTITSRGPDPVYGVVSDLFAITANSSLSYIGHSGDTNAIGYAPVDGRIYFNGTTIATGVFSTTGDVIGFLFDATIGANVFTVFQNNTQIGTRSIALTGSSFFPAVDPGGTGSGSVTLNSILTYSPPSGSVQW